MAPQQRDISGPKGLHNSLVKEPSPGACTSLCQHVFISFFRASFYVFNPVLKIIFMACCVFFIVVEWKSAVLVAFIMCADFFLSLLADFVVTNVFSSSFLLDFVFLFRLYDDTKHSALSGAEHSFSCSFAVAQVPWVVVGVITASNRCSRCWRRQDWEVSSCRCFVNADQAHRTLSDPVLHLGWFPGN